MSILAKGSSEPMPVIDVEVEDVKETDVIDDINNAVISGVSDPHTDITDYHGVKTENVETPEEEPETNHKIVELDWDVVVGDKEYKVIIAEGLNHNFQNNDLGRTDLWMCPRNEEPNENNITPYVGVLGGVCWDVLSTKYNDIVDVLDDDGNPVYKVCVTKTSYIVTRNEKYFAPVSSRAAGEQLISQIEGINLFTAYKYEDKLVGHKIYWNDQPAVIAGIKDGELTILADGIDHFELPLYMRKKFDIDENTKYNKMLAFVNDQYIYWTRE